MFFCETHDPNAGCPAGCIEAYAYLERNAAEPWAFDRKLCVAWDDAHGPTYRSAWWADIDGERLFLLSGQGCGPSLHWRPIEWTECTGALDEPEACRSLCAQDVCPGEIDVAEIDSCDVATPCPEIILNGSCTPELMCLFNALHDRTPGRYSVRLSYPNSGAQWRLLVASDGSVQATHAITQALVCDPFPFIWRTSRACQLAAPETFDACLQPQQRGTGRFYPSEQDLSPWLLDCVEMPALCP